MYDKFKILLAVRSIDEYKNFGVILDYGNRREQLAEANCPFQLAVVLTPVSKQIKGLSNLLSSYTEKTNSNTIISPMGKELASLGLSCGTAVLGAIIGGVAAVPTLGLSTVAAVAGAWQCGVSIGRVLNESDVNEILSKSNNDILDNDESGLTVGFRVVNTLADIVQILDAAHTITGLLKYGKYLKKYPEYSKLTQATGKNASKAKIKEVIGRLFTSKGQKRELIAEMKKMMDEQLTPDQWKKLLKEVNINEMKRIIHDINKARGGAVKQLTEALNGAVNIYASYDNGVIGNSLDLLNTKWAISIEKI